MRSLLVISVVLVLVDGGLASNSNQKEKKGEKSIVVKGPYQTLFKSYTYTRMDNTDHKIDVWYPIGVADRVPFISYAHGRTFGGPYVPHRYKSLLNATAAFGYVIAAHESCDKGCGEDNVTLPNDPTGFGTAYNEQLKVIDWAKKQGSDGDAVFKLVNFDIGVGVAGHSMGGQETVFSSSSHGAGHDIKAAVMHHLFTHHFPQPIVPFLVFTGTADVIAAPWMTRTVFDTKGAYPTRGFVKKLGGNHFATSEGGSWALAAYTAAWFKIFLDKTPQEGTVDYNAMIFGTGRDSLCHGGYGVVGGAGECTVGTFDHADDDGVGTLMAIEADGSLDGLAVDDITEADSAEASESLRIDAAAEQALTREQ